MKKIGFLLATVIMLVLFAFSASAETEGYYTYKVENGEATITYVSISVSGNVIIPDTLGGYPVTSIGERAFESCSSLKSITIPDSVTTIGNYAFRYCDGLTSITIPDSVTTIGDYAFSDCGSLLSIIVDKNNQNYSSEEYGALFNKEKTKLVKHPEGYKIASYSIPNSVTTIGVAAFSGCDCLESITIPDSVTTIGASAFNGCGSLLSITIPDSVTTIGDYAFDGCESLESITIPDGVTTIGDCTFYWCSGLTSISIPNSVTTIGAAAFNECTRLTSITIPDSVTTIGDSAFSLCYSLTNIAIPDGVTTISDYTFDECGLTSITIPDSVTTIGDHAFYRCYRLKDVYYIGTEDQWKKIKISSYNENLTNAKIHFHKHEYVSSVIKEATCTSDGAKVYTCSCGDSYTEAIDAIGHSWAAATCILKKTCSVCGATEGEALGHSYSAKFITDTEPTYTQAGSKSRHCTRENCDAKTDVTAIPKLVLGVPQNLKASSKDTTITLTWDKVDGAKGYRVYRYNNGWKAVKTTTATSYTVTGLTAGTSYRFAVKAYTKNGSTAIWTPKFSEIKTATAPVPPVTVKQTAGTDKTVTVKWDACKNATGYRVYKYNSSTKKWETVVKATTKLTAKISGLSANRQYYIAVKPYTKTESGYVWGTAFTKILVGTAPATPTVKLVSTSKGRATIAWNNVAGEKGYQVYYSTSATSGFKKISNYNADVVKAYKTGLTSGQTYYFKVRSYKVYNGIYVYSPYSTVKSVKIK